MAKHTFTRYGLSGVVFTLLGPGIFWLAYPTGPFLALAIAEASCHFLRYLSFRYLVFPRSHGFHVSVPRYIVAAIPTTLTGIVVVAIFSNLLGRTTLTLLVALFSVSVGFLWSRFVYKQPRGEKQPNKLS
jgi:fucose 4-O-acetylase-like acetyltransferase